MLPANDNRLSSALRARQEFDRWARRDEQRRQWTIAGLIALLVLGAFALGAICAGACG
jgi:hypothetical protein